jgi:hypothetical protein
LSLDRFHYLNINYFWCQTISQVPAKAEEITIPADVTPERVPTHIVDYSCKSNLYQICEIYVDVLKLNTSH